MNKIKKLHKGMTLLEVIVAMSIFSIGAAAVTMAFASAVKYNSLNQRRDEELAYQQAAIQNGNTTGLELYDGHDKNMELCFKVNGAAYEDKALNELAEKDAALKTAASKIKNEIKFLEKDGASYKVVSTFTGFSEYKATKSGKNDGVYDFELKDFGKGNLGSASVTPVKADGKYKITFNNTLDKNIDVQLLLEDGTIYEGSYDSGYRHASRVYTRSVGKASATGIEDSESGTSSPSSFEVGYYNAALSAAGKSIKVVVFMDGSIKSQMEINNSKLLESSCKGVLELGLNASGNLTAKYDSEV